MSIELALWARRWHEARMVREAKYARSGGSLLAFSVLAGAFVGALLGQPSIGFLAGSALGLVLVIAVLLLDRR